MLIGAPFTVCQASILLVLAVGHIVLSIDVLGSKSSRVCVFSVRVLLLWWHIHDGVGLNRIVITIAVSCVAVVHWCCASGAAVTCDNALQPQFPI